MFMSTTAPSTATSSASGASSAPSTHHSTRSIRSMGSDIVSTSNDDADLRLKWSGRFSEERVRQTRVEAVATASALNAAGNERGEAILAAVSRSTGSRLRLYRPD